MSASYDSGEVFDAMMMSEINRIIRDGVQDGNDLFALGVFLDLMPLADPADPVSEAVVYSARSAARRAIHSAIRRNTAGWVYQVCGRSWAIDDIREEVLCFMERTHTVNDPASDH